MPSRYASSPVSRRSPTCKAKRLLLRDIRPTPKNGNNSLLRAADLCQHQCIYCDIWKLALLVYACGHTSSSSNPASPVTTPISSRHTTPISPNFTRLAASTPAEHEYQQSLKIIELDHHTQRTTLSSILSICTADGAEECEGLRMAHDRCLSAVLGLIRRERSLRRDFALRQEEQMMWEQEAREWQARQWEMEARERERSYGYGYNHNRRESEISCAM